MAEAFIKGITAADVYPAENILVSDIRPERLDFLAKEYGVDVELAVRVAKCESGLDPSAVNKNSNGSQDRGLFQWNDRWHPEISNDSAFNAEASTIAFCKAVNNGNLSWWDASKTCWGV